MTLAIRRCLLLLSVCVLWEVLAQALSLSPLYAQTQERHLNIFSELKSMSLGSYSAFTMTVEGVDDKLASHEWKAFLKEYGAKTKRSKPESYKTEGVRISSIGGANPLDVYADIDERGDDIKMYVWINSRGTFLDDKSAAGDVEAAKNLLREFALMLRRAGIQEELAAEQKELEKVQKRLDLLARDIARSERDIENAKRTIEKAEADIARDQAAAAETEAALAKQNEAVQAVADKLAAVGS